MTDGVAMRTTTAIPNLVQALAPYRGKAAVPAAAAGPMHVAEAGIAGAVQLKLFGR